VARWLRIMGIAVIILGVLAFAVLANLVELLEPPQAAVYKVTVSMGGEVYEYYVNVTYKLVAPGKIILVNEGASAQPPQEALGLLEEYLQGEVLEVVTLFFSSPGYETEVFPGSTIFEYRADSYSLATYGYISYGEPSGMEATYTITPERDIEVYVVINSTHWLINAYALLDKTNTTGVDLEMKIEPVEVEGRGLSLTRLLIIAMITILPTLLVGLALIAIDNRIHKPTAGAPRPA